MVDRTTLRDLNYKKKPIVIEAMQLEERTLCSFFEFLGESRNYPECKIGGINPVTGKMTIKTLEGDMIAEVGDWIIKGINGEFYPCKPDIFEKTYDKVIEEKEYKREEKTDCKHKWIYNQIINVFKNTIKYEITCSKCGYIPPEGYIPDERTEGIIQTLNLSKNQLSKFKNYWSTNKEKEGELKTLKDLDVFLIIQKTKAEKIRNKNSEIYRLGYRECLKEVRKELGIKWIKKLQSELKDMPKYEGFVASWDEPRVNEIYGIINWIKHILNILEKDIEQ